MKPIILIGYMGCGKSAIGRKLSSELKYPLYDTDSMIVNNEGCSINVIFASKGEPYFRDLETNLLKDLLNKENTDIVLSTGGGMPIRDENAKLLKKIGTVVYLRALPETIYERVKYDTARPLLQCEDPLSKIKSMMKERGPKYENAATLVIDVDGKSIEEIVGEIKNEVISN